MTDGGTADRPLTAADRQFARRALSRKPLFLWLSVAGIVVALGLAVGYGVRRSTDPGFAIGPPAVIVLLVLLNARQNLRQYRYVRVLESFSATILGTDEHDPTSGRGDRDA